MTNGAETMTIGLVGDVEAGYQVQVREISAVGVVVGVEGREYATLLCERPSADARRVSVFGHAPPLPVTSIISTGI